MKIVKDWPPNIDTIRLFLKPNKGAVFCYGDTIYNPSGKELTADVIYHEEVHSKQQGDNPEAWYTEYLRNPAFRLREELEAYGQQWLFVKEKVKDAKLREWIKENMALALSGEEYGTLISYGQAESKIRNYKAKEGRY